MADEKYPRYPTDEEALNTFSQEDLIKAIDEQYAKRQSVTLVRFEYNHGVEMTPDIMFAFVTLAKEIREVTELAVTVEGDHIMRPQTYTEAKTSVINSRKTEMRYGRGPENPWYSIHDPEFLASLSETDSNG